MIPYGTLLVVPLYMVDEILFSYSVIIMFYEIGCVVSELLNRYYQYTYIDLLLWSICDQCLRI